MSVSFTRFKELVATGALEPARSNMFTVTIELPPFMRDSTMDFGGHQQYYESIDYFADQVTITSRNLMTGEVTNFGTMRRYATQQTPQDLNIQFIVTKNMFHRYLFERWINGVSRDSENRTQFYDNYVSDIIITKWEPGGNLVVKSRDGKVRLNKITAQWRAVGCFPYNISTMTFSNDQTQLMKLDVQFYIERIRMGTSVKYNGDWTNEVVTELTTGGAPKVTQAASPGAVSSSTSKSDGTSASGAVIDAASGVSRMVEAGLPYVGRNVGPLARWDGI